MSNKLVLLDEATKISAQEVISHVSDSNISEIIINVDGRAISVGNESVELIMHVLHHAAGGGRITIESIPEQLTTTTAAQILGISRPTLVKRVRDGQINAIKVGSHHRIELAELERYAEQQRQKKRALLRRMDALADELEETKAAGQRCGAV